MESRMMENSSLGNKNEPNWQKKNDVKRVPIRLETYTSLAFLVSMIQTPLRYALTRFEQSSIWGRDEKK